VGRRPGGRGTLHATSSFAVLDPSGDAAARAGADTSDLDAEVPDTADLATAVPTDAVAPASNRRWERATGLTIAGLILLIYVVTNPNRHNFYEHFTWQAAAWLEGQIGIRYPVCLEDSQNPDCRYRVASGQPYNDFFLDVLPQRDARGQLTGRALIPFPPLPALVLLPLVALYGLSTDAQLLAALLGGLDVWLAWWVLGALRLRLGLRAAVTVFFGLGTVFWYTSMLGTTWYFAHVVAVGLTLLALGIALGADRPAVADALAAVGAGPQAAGPDGPAPMGGRVRSTIAGIRTELGEGVRHGPWTLIDGRQFLAGFVLGLACLARLTVVFGLPFLAFVGAGGVRRGGDTGKGGAVRRVLSAGLGAGLPILALVAYNLTTTGHIFHPAYEYLYRQEAYGYPELGYNPHWAIEDLRYIPQNLSLMLAGLPDVLPACPPGVAREAFSEACPFVIPRSVGMSILLTSPAYLLAIPAVRRAVRSRLIAGATIAVVAIAVVNLMHFSQGWVQFGYRFSNDFAPFALVLVGLGLAGIGRVRGWPGLLIAASLAVNAWGVAWGIILQW
jgi:hypothetical protein